MQISRVALVRAAAGALFITGAVLLIVGTSGGATPFIVAGVILVLVGGAAGFTSAIESPSRLRIMTSTTATA